MKRTRAVSTTEQDARDFSTLKRRKEGMKGNKLFKTRSLKDSAMFRSIIVILLPV